MSNEKNVLSVISDKVSAISESVTETSIAAQKGFDLTLEAGKFLGRIFGPAATELGGILGDEFKVWKALNLNRLASKVNKIMDERGIIPEALQHLPFSVAYRAVEAASLEDDEDVLTLWAELLTNAMDPNNEAHVKKVYVDLLKSLSAVEVGLLNLLWEIEQTQFFRNSEDTEAFENSMNSLAEKCWRHFSKADRDTAVQNLARLGCIAYRPHPPSLGTMFMTLPRELGISQDFGLISIKGLQSMFKHLEENMFRASGIVKEQPKSFVPLQHALPGARVGNSGYLLTKHRIEVPEMNYLLTVMGKDLLSACKVRVHANADPKEVSSS